MDLKALFIKYVKHREKLNKGKIYKIEDNSNGNIYIGSTCKTLKERLSKHKSNYKRYLNGFGSNVRSYDIIKNNNFTIKLLEKCNIKTKQELYQRERYYVENNDCLNKQIPGRTEKEYKKAYRIDNKDKINEYNKEYNIENKDKIKQKNKAYRENNKDILNEKNICKCGGKFTNKHKTTHFKSNKHLEFIKNK
jgi:hypothetical protein